MLRKLKQAQTPAMLWQGNNGFLLFDGAHMIATDLDLTLPERLHAPSVRLEELSQELDLLLITHDHGDHFSTGTVQALLQHSRCRFVIPESCRETAQSIGGLMERAVFCKPGDRLMMDFLPVECVRAIHGHIAGSVYSGASLMDCGYRFAFGGLHFYQPGDTLLLEEHLEMQDVDVLFVSPTEHNMGVHSAVRFIRSIRPRRVILQHHSTYREQPDNLFWTHGFVKELLDALTPEERAQCIVPDQNRVIPLAEGNAASG